MCSLFILIYLTNVLLGQDQPRIETVAGNLKFSGHFTVPYFLEFYRMQILGYNYYCFRTEVDFEFYQSF